MAFPSSPTNGQTATVNNVVYQYASATRAWTRVVGSIGNLTVSNLTVTTDSVIGRNKTVLGNIYIGTGANTTSFSNPALVGYKSGTNYIQAALVNSTSTGSADWIAYGNNGNDTQGWVDMGFTGNTFNDTAYTITGFNDGYIFANGVTGNSSLGGNLVIATGSGGSTNDIIFATGGFWSNKEVMRFSNATATFRITGSLNTTSNSTVSALTVNNSATIGTTLRVTAGIQNTPIGNVTASSGAFTTISTTSTVTVNSTNAVTAIANGGSTGTGNIGATGAVFNTIFAKATSAQYADLAEKYLPDMYYTPGTVVVFGGEKEITQSTKFADNKVAGVISTAPAYQMNSDLDGGLYVALTGRVPCKVVGKIERGNMLVSSGIPGVATALDEPKLGQVIGKSLEDYNSEDVGVIEVVVGRM